MAQYDTIFKNATVVNHDGEGLADIAVRGGRIAAIGTIAGDAAQVVDCKGLHILPGVIDTQVHFREPGLTHKEISNAARSAR
ncbi:dihydroorotase [Devosia crocina]|uniref:Dihydroorotase n=1 Tax=Devosia crocina TaxID=429728 RepID=A0A1I7NNG7_9HYPH|nr:dihydroorotase [Devosia crocina]